MIRVITLIAVLSPSLPAEELSAFQRFGIENRSKLPALFGAAICIARDTRTTAKNEIAKEHRYAREGGVVDKEKLYELQKRLRWADENEAANLKNAKTWKAKPLACSGAVVKRLMACKLERECADGDESTVQFLSVYEDHE